MLCPPSPKDGGWGPRFRPRTPTQRLLLAGACRVVRQAPFWLGEVVWCCYSLAFTAAAAASSSLPVRIAVFSPAAAGTPKIESTSLSTSAENGAPQPVASGAENALSTSDPPSRRNRAPPSRISSSPAAPWIGLFGAGGLVYPVVRFRMIGLASDPT